MDAEELKRIRFDSEEEFQAYLKASCDASGVPLKITDRAVIARIARLLQA